MGFTPINFTNYPQFASITTYITNKEIRTYCQSVNAMGIAQTCLIELSFHYLDNDASYGSNAGGSLLFWLHILSKPEDDLSKNITSTINVEINPFTSSLNCNCTITANIEASLKICKDELCESENSPRQFKLNDDIYIIMELKDQVRDNYYLNVSSLYLCLTINGTILEYNQICRDYKDFAEILERIKGKVMMKIKAPTVGNITIQVTSLLVHDDELKRRLNGDPLGVQQVCNFSVIDDVKEGDRKLIVIVSAIVMIIIVIAFGIPLFIMIR